MVTDNAIIEKNAISLERNYASSVYAPKSRMTAQCLPAYSGKNLRVASSMKLPDFFARLTANLSPNMARSGAACIFHAALSPLFDAVEAAPMESDITAALHVSSVI